MLLLKYDLTARLFDGNGVAALGTGKCLAGSRSNEGNIASVEGYRTFYGLTIDADRSGVAFDLDLERRKIYSHGACIGIQCFFGDL